MTELVVESAFTVVALVSAAWAVAVTRLALRGPLWVPRSGPTPCLCVRVPWRHGGSWRRRRVLALRWPNRWRPHHELSWRGVVMNWFVSKAALFWLIEASIFAATATWLAVAVIVWFAVGQVHAFYRWRRLPVEPADVAGGGR
jgi:hypothetical protein